MRRFKLILELDVDGDNEQYSEVVGKMMLSLTGTKATLHKTTSSLIGGACLKCGTKLEIKYNKCASCADEDGP